MSISRIIIYNLTLTNANEEYSQAIASFAHKIEIKCRTFADMRLAYVSGESGTTYVTIPAGSGRTIAAADGRPISGILTLYLQSPSAGVVAEIEAYV